MDRRLRDKLAAVCGVVAAMLASFGVIAGPASADDGDGRQIRMDMLDRLPEGTMSQMADSTKAVGFPGLTWPGSVVTVAFNGGDPRVYPLIEAAASEWTASGGRLRFSFKRADGSYRTWRESDITPSAAIRIGFFTDNQRNGYWSAVGTLARRVNPSEATMNFGGMGTSLSMFYNGAKPDSWKKTYAHTVVLHEFGHALGLNHEHFHPRCQADLKLPQIVNYLMGPPNGWPRQRAMFNMDASTYLQAMSGQIGGQNAVFSPDADQNSVMLYSFNDEYYKSGATSPCRPAGELRYATGLSGGDKHYYLANYGSGGQTAGQIDVRADLPPLPPLGIAIPDGPIQWVTPYQDWRDAAGTCVVGKTCWSQLTQPQRRSWLALQEAKTALYRKNADGSLTYLTGGLTGSKGEYRVMQYIMIYNNQPCDGENWGKGIDRVGVMIRVQADIRTKKSGLNIASILPIGINASSSTVDGQITINSWGITSSNSIFNSYMGFAGKVENADAISKAVESLAVGNAMMQDNDTEFLPYVLARQEASAGSCS